MMDGGTGDSLPFTSTAILEWFQLLAALRLGFVYVITPCGFTPLHRSGG